MPTKLGMADEAFHVLLETGIRTQTLLIWKDELADPTKRVLDNLIDNTIVHSPAGGHINVEAAAGDGRLRVSVTTERVRIGGLQNLHG